MDPHESPAQWRITSRFSAEELATVWTLIRSHAYRLQEQCGTVTAAALADAVLRDVEADPDLAAGLGENDDRRAVRHGR